MDDGTPVFPVGHDLGAFHAGDGVTPPVEQVRVGADIVDLDPARFAAWTAAHGTPSADGTVPVSTAGGLRADHGEDVVAGLLRAGLLTEVEPAPAFAGKHRLLPLAQGLGNSEARPSVFSVGLLNQPLAVMTGATYDLWQWASLAPDLWWACQESASAAAQAGATEPGHTDPEQVLAGVVSVLPQLLAARVACLDVRIGGRHG